MKILTALMMNLSQIYVGISHERTPFTICEYVEVERYVPKTVYKIFT
jgi:hypothetical protein